MRASLQCLNGWDDVRQYALWNDGKIVPAAISIEIQSNVDVMYLRDMV